MPSTKKESAKNLTSPKDHRGIYTFGALAAADLPRPVVAVEGLLWEGADGFLAGRFAIGKTLLGLQLAVSLATGREFVGRSVHRPYKVAVIDCENGAAEVKHRLLAQVGGLDLSSDHLGLLNTNLIYVDREEGGSLQHLKLSSDGFSLLEAFIKRHGIEALIIDNFGRIFPYEETDEAKVKLFFTDLAKKRLVCPTLKHGFLLFLHHLTKPSTDNQITLLKQPYDFLSRTRGTGRLLDFFPTRLAMADEHDSKGETYFVVNGYARNGSVSPLILERQDESLLFTLHADKRLVVERVFGPAQRKAELYRLIESTLTQQFTFEQAAQLLDKEGKRFSRPTVSDTLKAAKANGLLIQNADKSYTRIADVETNSPSPLNSLNCD